MDDKKLRSEAIKIGQSVTYFLKGPIKTLACKSVEFGLAKPERTAVALEEILLVWDSLLPLFEECATSVAIMEGMAGEFRNLIKERINMAALEKNYAKKFEETIDNLFGEFKYSAIVQEMREEHANMSPELKKKADDALNNEIEKLGLDRQEAPING